tara:strand:+ start:983 stop:1741 length:759 start_codon:yes stop_codon:yes gene_type:complete
MIFFRNIKDFINSFTYPKNQFFLVSFPKTGRTWLKHMLIKIQERSSTNIKIFDTHDMSEIIIENGMRQDPYYLFKFTNRFYYRRSKVLFLVRDPRDVIVSHFYQVTKRAKDPFIFSSISEFVQNDILGFRRILHFYNLWFKSKKIPRSFYLLKYEDLLNDGIDKLYDICDFLGIETTRDIVMEVYNESSADKMRNQEINNQLDGFKYFGKERNQLKVRNAIIGGYLKELSKNDIQYCNKHMNDLNTYFGYNI